MPPFEVVCLGDVFGDDVGDDCLFPGEDVLVEVFLPFLARGGSSVGVEVVDLLGSVVEDSTVTERSIPGRLGGGVPGTT